MGNCAECFRNGNGEEVDNDKQSSYDPLLDDSSKGPKNNYDSIHSNVTTQPDSKISSNSKMDAEQIDIENENPQYQRHSKQLKISVSDFDFLKVLGRGSFGKVLLVQKKGTQKLFAMKILKKSIIAQKNQVIHTKCERQILQNMNSPFIVQLHYAFQSFDKLYFVMDFMIGGELFFHLRKSYKFNEDRSKLYSAELILAIEYLHDRGIIYRDLKPENILLGGDGHLKIADFGLSKQGIEEGVKTNTFCGTPEYLAPEILLNRGHDKSVDWYSLGCLLYEMLSGAPPFYSRDKQKMFRNRLERPIEMRTWFSASAQDIVKGLLQKDPRKRLGSGGPEEIKQHPFFKDIDWEKLKNKGYEPPFKPKTVNDRDLRHFDKMFTNEILADTPSQNIQDNKQQQHYDGFTYGEQSINPSLLGNQSQQNSNANRFQVDSEQVIQEVDEETKRQTMDDPNMVNPQNINNNSNNQQEQKGQVISMQEQNKQLDGENTSIIKDKKKGNNDSFGTDDDEQQDLKDDHLIEVNHNFSLLKKENDQL